MFIPNSIPIWQVDAFADRPFSGNPAAVCILENFPSNHWMQNVAAEMNLSETAFIVPTDESNSFHLRWFTPATEVDLCGHATLAAAHTLIEQKRIDTNLPIRFQTRSGELPCSQSGSRITLDFPLVSARGDVESDTKNALLAALGIQEAVVLRTKFDLVAAVSDARIVEALRPDFNALEKIETRGAMITASSRIDGVDFISRFFAPRCGINEDPVTGSAHCFLAPFWAKQLNKTSLVGHQASSRGGKVYCEVAGDRVHLSGNAVTVWKGHLLVAPE
ncbi:putative isomerase YddE [Rubripirellula tenax]|uniref:Putative isomerase YddE n=1 Tax=Rubripirellula tenax TaxID=2528015 RepID=A0A5C6ECD1_9BACT|nr:PhzF family phenazine biosynthesis protein [Rubripirellula tenax]TWU44819.1 putative isomerase YddE [Rubripirellula tenax]